MKCSPTVVLLFLALTSVPAECIEFGLLFKEISDCISELCSKHITMCNLLYGKTHPHYYQVCVALICEKPVHLCMSWFATGFINGLKDQGMYKSTQVVKRVTDAGVGKIADSYLHCIKQKHYFDAVTSCFLERLLGEAQPQINLMTSLVFSDPDYVTCWLRRAFTGMISCIKSLDMNTLQTWVENTGEEITADQQELVECFMTLFRSKACHQMYRRMYGSTVFMQEQQKDLFICSINQGIFAAAAC